MTMLMLYFQSVRVRYLQTALLRCSALSNALDSLRTKQKEISHNAVMVKSEIEYFTQALIKTVQQSGEELKQTMDKLVKGMLQDIAEKISRGGSGPEPVEELIILSIGTLTTSNSFLTLTSWFVVL